MVSLIRRDLNVQREIPVFLAAKTGHAALHLWLLSLCCSWHVVIPACRQAGL